MLQELGVAAEHDATWLAIRQPAVVRMLERDLATGDGDALAAGLELACRVLGGRTSLGALRLDHRALQAGMQAVRAGKCDRAMVRSLRDQIADLPIILTSAETDRVATAIAAVIWAILAASMSDFEDDDTLLA